MSNSISFGLAPADEPNRRLLENVHPPSWVNPEPQPRYHLVVIGAGTAGLVAAAGAAALGARVALVERHLMGGDCLNVGCVPSKSVLRAARAWHAVQKGQQRFAAAATVGGGDFGRVMERTRELRAQISKNDGAPRFRDLGVDVFLGDGQFVAPDAIEVAGARRGFRRALIATGGRPAVPPISGLSSVGCLTNETVFNLTELPRRLAVIGAGPIGCELAQAFARLGAHVALFDSDTQILHREPADAAATVQASMALDGVRIELGTRIVEVLPRGRDGRDKVVRFERNGQSDEFVANEILVTAGRRPNLEAVGLEAAGVQYGASGVTVDDRLRTSNPKVYAAGDVCSKLHFTHNSDAQARIVLANALFPSGQKVSRLTVPWCTYTSPEVGHVGLTEADAVQRGIAIDTLTVPLHDVDRAVLDGEDDGFLRLRLKKGTDRILGATLVAEHAGEMLGALCLAVTHGIGLEKIAATVFPYPTQSEALKRAADQWRRGKLTSSAKRMLRLWFWMKR
jgi:pyruvate/2-oxoglutarate dehydrogenase complex dihydrolipoamide dehydrogenase (E3) component